MGLGRVQVEAIVGEYVYKPICGDVLFISRWTVCTPHKHVAMLRENGIVPS
jgi:hypothetical protein